MYEAYSSCLLLPWHEPTQKTKPTTITIASATRPASLASATAPGGGGEGRRGPLGRVGLIRRRGRSGDSSVSGSSKNSTSVPSSNVLTWVASLTVSGRTVRRGRQSPLGMGEAAPELTGIELVLDRYRPLRPLGSGGSGSVWLARDEHTGLDVALKIVAREGKAAARAEREAAAAARLRHRSCLRAYAFRRDSRHVYIAYEFVPGRTFREALRAGELNDASALEACSQICDGLAHAHAAGILHRDVKPSNVLLADGERVSVRLLDFGLARMAEAETLTAQGDVPGTLAYISPERLAGDEATEAADVWAVGVMLWEALAGQHPFWQASMLDTARAIEHGAPSLAHLRPDLPKALIAVVDRALSLSP